MLQSNEGVLKADIDAFVSILRISDRFHAKIMIIPSWQCACY